MPRQKPTRAVTALELAIMVILLILMAMLGFVALSFWRRYSPPPPPIPNLPPGHLQYRSEMLQIGDALKAYKVDWNAYPPPTLVIEATTGTAGTKVTDAASSWIISHRLLEPDPESDPAAAMHQWPAALTTPIAYLATVPKDPFSSTPADYRYRSYVFIAPDKTRHDVFILNGVGPDRDWDLPMDRIRLTPDSFENPAWSRGTEFNLPRDIGDYTYYQGIDPNRKTGDAILLVFPEDSWFAQPMPPRMM